MPPARRASSALPRSAPPTHSLHIVSGKGGTGKTTVAAALACALATAGRRILLCEVEGRDGIGQLFNARAAPGERLIMSTNAGGQVYGLAIDAQAALLEYLDTFYRLGIAGRALDKFGVIDFATSIAPGLRDVLLTGKVYEAVRRRERGLDHSFDAVVLDAPPTGRLTAFLNVHEAVSGLAKVGPVRRQADSIMTMLRSSSTVVHLVTLLEDMPVTETAEAIDELTPTGIKVGTVIANQVTASSLTAEQLRLASRGELALQFGSSERHGLSDDQIDALASEFRATANRVLDELDCAQRLQQLDRPIVGLPHDPLGIDATTIASLAATLAAQLSSEIDA